MKYSLFKNIIADYVTISILQIELSCSLLIQDANCKILQNIMILEEIFNNKQHVSEKISEELSHSVWKQGNHLHWTGAF